MEADTGHETVEISYADDIPYEVQLPDPTVTEHERTASLKGRIGNRIYLLEDSSTKKRNFADLDDSANEQEEDVEVDADLPHRPNALLLQGPPITQIPTARVFAYATHFDAHPIGLEWVDDQTCVLVFASRKAALQAWNALCKPLQPGNTIPGHMEDTMVMDAVNFHGTSYFAQPLPLALYPIEERINSALGNKKSDALKEAIRIRWALSSDVKERGARVKSEFYKRHGETAGKESLPGFSGVEENAEARHRSKRRKQNEEETRRQLDADLDIFLAEDEIVSSMSPGTRVAGKPTNRDDRSEDRSRGREEKRRILDYELDSFLASEGHVEPSLEAAEQDQTRNTESRGPSLLDRTGINTPLTSQPLRDHSRQTKPLPRRDRRSRRDAPRYETGADGRWLHNSEILERRNNFDERGSGMRAWGSERPRRPKLRKTQEELDRELDEFGQQT